MAKLKFGLGQVRQHAPLWMQNLLAILAIIMGAQHLLIDNIPGITEEMKEAANGWFEYGIDAVQAVLAMVIIFLGKDRRNKPDTDNLLK